MDGQRWPDRVHRWLNLLPRNVSAILISRTNHIGPWTVTPPRFSVLPVQSAQPPLPPPSARLPFPTARVAQATASHASQVPIPSLHSVKCTTTPDLGQSLLQDHHWAAIGNIAESSACVSPAGSVGCLRSVPTQPSYR